MYEKYVKLRNQSPKTDYQVSKQESRGLLFQIGRVDEVNRSLRSLLF